MKHLSWLVVSVVLLLPSIGAATDPAAVAAALPDEASECRYLATLCTESRSAERSALEYQIAANRLGAQKDFDAAIAAIDKSTAYADRAIAIRIGMREALEVVSAKRGRLPACYQPCPVLLK